MSKIGKISISIPEKVKVVLAGNMLNIEGPLGKKSIDIDLEMFNLDIKDIWFRQTASWFCSFQN